MVVKGQKVYVAVIYRIILILTVFFFSAQSFAGSCPDGSEPVKSISADGTFLYTTVGGNHHHLLILAAGMTQIH